MNRTPLPFARPRPRRHRGLLGGRRRRRPAGPHRPPLVSRRAGLLHLRAAVRHPGGALPPRHRASSPAPTRTRPSPPGCGATPTTGTARRGPRTSGARASGRAATRGPASTGPACSPTASACAAPPTRSGSPRWRPCSATAAAAASASTATTPSRSSSPAAPTATGKWALLDHDLSTVVFDDRRRGAAVDPRGPRRLEAPHRPQPSGPRSSTAGWSAGCTPATAGVYAQLRGRRVPRRLRRAAADGPPAPRRDAAPLPPAGPGRRQDVRLLGPQLQHRRRPRPGAVADLGQPAGGDARLAARGPATSPARPASPTPSTPTSPTSPAATTARGSSRRTTAASSSSSPRPTSSPRRRRTTPTGASTSRAAATAWSCEGKATCPVAVSTDRGATWQDCGTFADGLDLTDRVKGRRQYWLRFHAGAKELAGTRADDDHDLPGERRGDAAAEGRRQPR